MGRKSIRAISMMLLMMTAGCLQAVDGVIEDIDTTIDALLVLELTESECSTH